MALGEDHRGVEPDDREPPGHAQDRLDHRLADLGPEVVQLGRVVPRERGAVVAVVDEPDLAGCPIAPPEHDGGVARVPVVVLEEDLDGRIGRQVRPAERVRRVGSLRDRQEPIRVLDDPARVDPHVVRDHVRGEPDASARRPIAEVRVGGLAAEVVGDPVVVQRVGGGRRVRVAAKALDLARRRGCAARSRSARGPVTPHAASRSSSSSGIASSVRMSRPWRRDSWSSQT